MDEKPKSYRWQPIQDIPSNFSELRSEELAALRRVWEEQRGQIEQNAGLQEFVQRLNRQWAIETGVIEGVYKLERGVTQLLIEHGIDASLIPRTSTDKSPDLVAQIIRDNKDVVDSLFDFVKGDRSLSTSYIKEMHAVFTRNQPTSDAIDQFGRIFQVPLLSGDYKKLPNNPMREDGLLHEYAPPEQVTSEMDNLIALHKVHEDSDVPPEIEAAWLHHRFTQIHPFQDGNGRVARALASLVFIRHGGFPVLITRDDPKDNTADETTHAPYKESSFVANKTSYIAALEQADRGDLGPLVALFVSTQRRAFVSALGIAADVLQTAKVEQQIEAARHLLKHRKESLRHEWEKAKLLATNLQNSGVQRFNAIAAQLTAKLTDEIPSSSFFSDSAGDGQNKSHYFRRQIVQGARRLDYFANTDIYRAWVRLVLKVEEGDSQSEILLSFHGIGHEYRGILAATLSFYRRQQTGEGDREVGEVTPLSDDIFQINYLESDKVTQERFKDWLEAGLGRGLQIWRASL